MTQKKYPPVNPKDLEGGQKYYEELMASKSTSARKSTPVKAKVPTCGQESTAATKTAIGKDTKTPRKSSRLSLSNEAVVRSSGGSSSGKKPAVSSGKKRPADGDGSETSENPASKKQKTPERESALPKRRTRRPSIPASFGGSRTTSQRRKRRASVAATGTTQKGSSKKKNETTQQQAKRWAEAEKKKAERVAAAAAAVAAAQQQQQAQTTDVAPNRRASSGATTPKTSQQQQQQSHVLNKLPTRRHSAAKASAPRASLQQPALQEPEKEEDDDNESCVNGFDDKQEDNHLDNVVYGREEKKSAGWKTAMTVSIVLLVLFVLVVTTTSFLFTNGGGNLDIFRPLIKPKRTTPGHHCFQDYPQRSLTTEHTDCDGTCQWEAPHCREVPEAARFPFPTHGSCVGGQLTACLSEHLTIDDKNMQCVLTKEALHTVQLVKELLGRLTVNSICGNPSMGPEIIEFDDETGRPLFDLQGIARSLQRRFDLTLVSEGNKEEHTFMVNHRMNTSTEVGKKLLLVGLHTQIQINRPIPCKIKQFASDAKTFTGEMLWTATFGAGTSALSAFWVVPWTTTLMLAVVALVFIKWRNKQAAVRSRNQEQADITNLYKKTCKELKERMGTFVFASDLSDKIAGHAKDDPLHKYLWPRVLKKFQKNGHVARAWQNGDLLLKWCDGTEPTDEHS